MEINKTKHIKATKTHEGFIELTSLDELDQIVGGLVDPEVAICEIEESGDFGRNEKSIL